MMDKKRKSNIIFVSSTASTDPSIGRFAYASSKSALDITAKTLSLELARYNIRTNSIHPGYIETPMISGFDTDSETNVEDGVQMMRDYCAYRVPSGRVGKSEDITNIVLFLASEASSYCNGSQFVCDGGLTSGEILPEV